MAYAPPGEDDRAPEPAPRPARAVAGLVASLIGIFILSQFFRTAIAVIAPDFMAETGISAANLACSPAPISFPRRRCSFPLASSSTATGRVSWCPH